MTTLSKIKTSLHAKASPERKAVSERFFKTGKGQYGEGDIFIGVTMPDTRAVAKEHFADVTLRDIEKLLHSKIHEERMLALVLLTLWYKKRDAKEAVALYKKNYDHINNWDLVDVSAPNVIGDWYLERDRKELYTLARSRNMWKRRIAIVSTYAFIRQNDLKDTFAIAEMLLPDTEDLTHKAVGWMFREAGKRDQKALETFLKKHHTDMPRTMLRYAIEKFPESKRQKYLKGFANTKKQAPNNK